ncbi:glucose import [Tritrichomonas musculus]|uniref:Glucose import n=1 Tax=Tritrichomonas musculus TaxID=1915356 RepID=A0ABR2JF99_9EUKA
MSCGSKILIYALIYMLGSVQFGFTLSYGSLPIEGLKKDYPNWDFNKDENKISYFTHFASLFGSIGGFLIRILAHFTSGRKALCIFSILDFVCWILYFLFTPNQFAIGIVLRSIQGVITGGFACLTPVLMTDMAPDDAVGMFGCLNQFGIVFGMVLFPILGAYVNFKIMAVVAAVFNAIHAALLWIVPENNKDKETKESIFQIKYVRAIFIGIMLMIFQQFCGMNAILGELTKIMANTGINLDENLQSAFSTSAQLVSVLIAAFNMDIIGRRKMWVFSTCGIILSLVLYIICLNANTFGWFKAASVFLLMLSFGQGYGPIPWFICHDIFPRSVRLDGQTLITFGNMISSFGVVYLFPVMNENLNENITMIIYTCITILAIPFGSYFIPKKTESNDANVTLI